MNIILHHTTVQQAINTSNATQHNISASLSASPPSRLPVHCAEGVVEQDEHDQLPVQQLVDAALPAQQQAGEGAQARVSHLPGVGHCHP